MEKKKHDFLSRVSRQPSVSEHENAQETQNNDTQSNETDKAKEPQYPDMSEALEWLVLRREAHESYLLKSVRSLENTYESLDASQPWLIYWLVHGLNLLGIDTEVDLQIE